MDRRGIALRPHAGIREGRLVAGRREPLLEKCAGEDRHSAEHAAVVVDRSDLPLLPGDQHDLPVFPEKDRVADVLRGIETDAIEVALRFRRDPFDERERRRPVGGLRGLDQPGGKLPLNTNGGGLSYMHSGMYGMYALQESVRQMRGIAPAQVKDAKISVCHGVGGMFAASGTIIFTNEK